MTKLNLDLNLGLDLKLAPKLTAQLRQSIGLLQLSHHDLRNIINEHLAKNPVLILAEPINNVKNSAPVTAVSPSFFEQNFKMTQLHSDAHGTNYKINNYASENNGSGEKKTEAHYEKLSSTPEYINFREDLLAQLPIIHLSELHFALTNYLIQNLDDRGFLLDDLDDILKDLKKISINIQMIDLQKAHKTLLTLIPIGVGARDVFECLRLNIEDILQNLVGINQREKRWQHQLALQLLDDLIEKQKQKKLHPKQNEGLALSALNLSFSLQQQKKIAMQLGVSPEKIKEIIALIRKLPQQPIQGAHKAFEQSDYIVVDIIVVEKIQQNQKVFEAFLNDALVPKLSINLDSIASLTENQSDYLKKKTQEANWLITSIEKRFDTLKKLATLIVSEQQKFFEHGESAMQPMTMQEAANQLGIHVSTVSRIICHKYLQCKRGTYPIRYFFSKELRSANGTVSSIAIKECIKNLINKNIEEGKSSNDLLLTQKLLDMGLNISRRTVAKYRKELGIQATHHRISKNKK